MCVVNQAYKQLQILLMYLTILADNYKYSHTNTEENQ